MGFGPNRRARASLSGLAQRVCKSLQVLLEKLLPHSPKTVHHLQLRIVKAFYEIFSMVLIMSSMPYDLEARDITGIPLACTKCNDTFETDSDYVVHFDERHAGIGQE